MGHEKTNWVNESKKKKKKENTKINFFFIFVEKKMLAFQRVHFKNLRWTCKSFWTHSMDTLSKKTLSPPLGVYGDEGLSLIKIELHKTLQNPAEVTFEGIR